MTILIFLFLLRKNGCGTYKCVLLIKWLETFVRSIFFFNFKRMDDKQCIEIFKIKFNINTLFQ